LAIAENDWSRAEVEATVDDYLRKMTKHLTGQAYSKMAHRRALRLRLDDRTDASRTADSPKIEERSSSRIAVRRDYLALEARNRSLGAAGEDFVVAFEH
jgi:hypothetical protein